VVAFDPMQLTPEEREALGVGPRLPGSVYFERYGVEIESRDRQRPLNLELTPFWSSPLDDWTDAETWMVLLVTGTQVGKTTALRMMAAEALHQRPAPMMFVFPTDEDARRFSQEHLVPTIESIDALDRQIALDRRRLATAERVMLEDATCWLTGLQKPAKAKSRTIRFLIGDEIEELPDDLAGQGDPLDLALERTRKYEATRKVALASTPGRLTGQAARRFQTGGDRRRFLVPCPKCGCRGVMSSKRTDWHGAAPVFEMGIAPGATAEDLEVAGASDLVWLTCPRCRATIHERDRRGMIERGRWVAYRNDDAAEAGEVGERIDEATGDLLTVPPGTTPEREADPGFEPDRWPVGTEPRPSQSRERSTVAGYWINAFYSPFLTLPMIAAKLKRARREGEGALRNFVNSWLAEPWVERLSTLRPGALRRRVDELLPPMTLPPWTVRTILAADTQADGWWWLLMAIGPLGRRHAAGWGFCALGTDVAGAPEGWRQLERIYDARLPGHGPPDLRIAAALLAVDSGGEKTADVYRLVRDSDCEAVAMKGESNPEAPHLFRHAAAPQLPGRVSDRGAAPLLLVNTHALKDRAHRSLTAPLPERPAPGSPMGLGDARAMTIASAGVDPMTGEELSPEVLCAQLSSEEKRLEAVGRPGRRVGTRGADRRAVEVWRTVRDGAANHLWDCNVYAEAAAVYLGVDFLEPSDPRVRAVEEARRHARSDPGRRAGRDGLAGAGEPQEAPERAGDGRESEGGGVHPASAPEAVAGLAGPRRPLYRGLPSMERLRGKL